MIPRFFFITALAATAALAGVVRRDIAEEALILPAEDVAVFEYNTISPDGTCGGATGFTCEGSDFGNCCNLDGYCGSTKAFCGANCFDEAGLCSSTMTTLVETPGASTDGVESTTTTPRPVHTPWNPINQHPPKFKPSYKIDNGERAPNQVWN
ncbi:hypothetical protein MBLNU459_g6546t1 [Dothideomycetes sp. NU459]